MSFEWAIAIAGALIAGLVQGLAGFAFGLVALSFFAFVLGPVQSVIVVTGLAFVFTFVGLLTLYREVEFRALGILLIGTVLGTPIGVWVLTSVAAATLRRLIGVVIIVAALLEMHRTQLRTLSSQSSRRGSDNCTRGTRTRIRVASYGATLRSRASDPKGRARVSTERVIYQAERNVRFTSAIRFSSRL